MSPALAGRFFTTEPIRVALEFMLSCAVMSDLCDHRHCSPPGSSVHGVLQARVLEWVVISFSGGIFPTQGLNPHLLCLLHRQADSLPLSHLGSLGREALRNAFLIDCEML